MAPLKRKSGTVDENGDTNGGDGGTDEKGLGKEQEPKLKSFEEVEKNTMIQGVDEGSPEFKTIEHMLDHMVETVLLETSQECKEFKQKYKPSKEPLQRSFRRVAERLDGRPLTFATMCSGTEAPLLAMQMFQEILAKKGTHLALNHKFSAEIDVNKAAYIERNFHPAALFRDVTQFGSADHTATTAYGSNIEIPMDVDLLVAGFSCVDFSRLNNNKKTLSQRGESGNTFYGILNYAYNYGPKLILMENVDTAPWTKTDKKASKKRKVGKGDSEQVELQTANVPIDTWLHICGYATRMVSVDTKDYYLPQCRNRTYMLAVKETLYGVSPDFRKRHTYEGGPELQREKLQKGLERWQTLLETMKVKATTSAESMVMDTQRFELPSPVWTETKALKNKNWAWDACRARYATWRENGRMGNGRPFTNWSEGCRKKMPDYWAHIKGMTERVLDTMDINFLTAARKGIDIRYFSRFHELSQNVDHGCPDRNDMGIIFCLTPTGIPVWTGQGKKLSGRELLALQGFPVSRMILSHLTDAQITNMNGNAMSTTVVGAAMLCALEAFAEVLSPFDRLGDGTLEDRLAIVPNPPINTGLAGEALLKVGKSCLDLVLTKASLEENSSKHLLQQALASRSLCACEKETHVFDRSFRRCVDCDHTTCKVCGGNPPHTYEEIPAEELQARKSPAHFKSRLRQMLPLKLRFNTASPEAHRIIEHIGTLHENADFARKALNCLFHWERTIRSEVWKNIYESTHATLQLVIEKSGVEWLLYLKPSLKVNRASKKGKVIAKQPVARMKPDMNFNILEGTWSVWHPEEARNIAASFEFSGRLVQSFGSWCRWPSTQKEHKALGSPPNETTLVLDKVEVKVPNANDALYIDVAGTYQYHKDCGQAFNSLHKRVHPPDSAEKQTFFFFDHSGQTGDAKNDHGYVFTNNARRLDHGDHRLILARLPGFKPPKFACKVERNNGKVTRTYALLNEKGEAGIYQSDKLSHTMDVQIKVEGAYKEQPGFSFYIPKRPDARALRKLPIEEQDPENAPLEWQGSQELGSELDQIEYQSLTTSPPSPQIEANESGCGLKIALFTCTVSMPNEADFNFPYARKMLWTEIKKQNTPRFFAEYGWLFEQGIVNAHYDGDEIHSWHAIGTVKNANPHDTCRKCAPEAPTNLWRVTKAGARERWESKQEAVVYEKLLKEVPQPITLMLHLNLARQLVFKIGANPVVLMHQARAKLATNNIFGTSIGDINLSWRFITNEDRSPGKKLMPHAIRTNCHILPIEQPSYLANDPSRPLLRDAQLRSIAWQIQQEENPPTFEEEEIVEARVPEIGLRLEGRASRSKTVRGGMILCPIGYGKTVVTLLMAYERRKADLEWMMEKHEGIIRLKATIIFVPKQLTAQWGKETSKFLPQCYKMKGAVLIVDTVKQLRELSIQDFMDALIIICNYEIFSHKGQHHYRKDLAAAAGLIGYHTTKNLSLQEDDTFYQLALRKIDANVEQLVGTYADRPHIFEDEVRSQINADWTRMREMESELEAEQALSKEDKAPNERSNNLAPTLKPNTLFRKGAQNFKEMRNCVLEMFSFARVVVDEFQYLKDMNYVVVASTKANARWLLSGTPPLLGFRSMQQGAGLLGVRLGIEDTASAPSDHFKKSIKGMLDSEKFRAYQPVSFSPAWHQRRHEQCLLFLDAFARTDTIDHKPIVREDKHCLVTLDSAHLASYREMEVVLGPKNFDATLDKNANGHAIELFKQAVDRDIEDGRYALKWRALFKTPATGKDEVQDNGSELAIIERRRHLEKQRLISDLEVTYKTATWYDKNLHMLAGEDLLTSLAQHKKHVLNNIQDPGVKLLIDSLIDKADKGYIWRHYIDILGDQQEWPVRNAKEKFLGKDYNWADARLKQLNSKLNSLTLRLIDYTHDEARIKAVRTIYDSIGPDIACPCCQSLKTSDEVIVLGRCGHLICNKCVPSELTDQECPVRNCYLSFAPHEKCLGSQLTVHPTDEPLGAKVGAIVKLLQAIDEENKQKSRTAKINEKEHVPEKVLLFVDSHRTSRFFRKVFEKENIAYSDMCMPRVMHQETLERFKEDNGGLVLMLKNGGSSAAGANLTNATRVIFASPYFSGGEHGETRFHATNEQAIGRAARFGQEKAVTVYWFISKYTIDVDIIENRTKKHLVSIPSANLGGDNEWALLAQPMRIGQSEFGSPLWEKAFSREVEEMVW